MLNKGACGAEHGSIWCQTREDMVPNMRLYGAEQGSIGYRTWEHTVTSKGAYGAICFLGNIQCQKRKHTVPNNGACGAVYVEYGTYGAICSLALTGHLHLSWNIFLYFIKEFGNV